MMASPSQKPSRRSRARRARPAITRAPTATKITGSHQGSPSGPISVNEQSATRAPSTTMIGSSAAISAFTQGLSAGAERRSAAILTPAPKLALKMLPRYPTLEAR
jgi:hypothetical protein